MIYLLDSNICIRYLNGRAPNIQTKMQSIPTAAIAVSSIVKAELFFGSAKSNYSAKSLLAQQEFLNQFASLPFDDKAAIIYGPMRAKLQAIGTPIGPLDMLIAAIALANHLILVTHNTAEFGRVDGLKLEDWEI